MVCFLGCPIYAVRKAQVYVIRPAIRVAAPPYRPDVCAVFNRWTAAAEKVEILRGVSFLVIVVDERAVDGDGKVGCGTIAGCNIRNPLLLRLWFPLAELGREGDEELTPLFRAGAIPWLSIF